MRRKSHRDKAPLPNPLIDRSFSTNQQAGCLRALRAFDLFSRLEADAGDGTGIMKLRNRRGHRLAGVEREETHLPIIGCWRVKVIRSWEQQCEWEWRELTACQQTQLGAHIEIGNLLGREVLEGKVWSSRDVRAAHGLGLVLEALGYEPDVVHLNLT